MIQLANKQSLFLALLTCSPNLDDSKTQAFSVTFYSGTEFKCIQMKRGLPWTYSYRLRQSRTQLQNVRVKPCAHQNSHCPFPALPLEDEGQICPWTQACNLCHQPHRVQSLEFRKMQMWPKDLCHHLKVIVFLGGFWNSNPGSHASWTNTLSISLTEFWSFEEASACCSDCLLQ